MSDNFQDWRRHEYVPRQFSEALYSSRGRKYSSTSQSWIYERTRKKAIPFHRLGKYVRFTTDDLAQIIASKSTATAVPQG